MDMEIKIWPDVSFWNSVVTGTPESTFFHTPLWHDLVVRTYADYAIATRGFIFPGGRKAVFPLIQTREGGLLKGKTRLKSSVFGGYGGIIAEDTLTEAEQGAMYDHLLSLKASISVDGNPFSRYSIPDTFTLKQDFTHVFALDSPEEELYKRLSRGAKSNLSQAKKKGVSVRTAESEEDVLRYFNIYQDTLKRWGDATLFAYPQEFLLNIYRHGGDAARLWVAEKDGTVIAGAIIFYWNQVVSYWHGASLQDYFDCYPNNLLHITIIGDALHRGHRYYDFGPSGGQHGVARFKQSFGAEKYEFFSGHWKYRWRKK
jgi:lipid II:glycine glycyltransferase (peptidoglycan interpeptide bridge formation enzyme)